LTRITSTTQLCALLGDPVAHSLSPVMHNAAFQFLGLDYVYLCLRVQPSGLRPAVAGVKSLGLRGFNVTIPHKVAVMAYLDAIDPLAQDIGAINTVVNRNGRLVGYNTDGAGGLRALRDAGVTLTGTKVVLLGAGGAARALAFSVAPLADQVVILNRTEAKAVALAASLRNRFDTTMRGGPLTRSALALELADADVLINSTSVGMHPQPEDSVVDADLLQARLTVFDAVYTPLETRLLREAGRVGAQTVDGLSMLVHQGALAFEIWTGVTPPLVVMSHAMKAAMEG
jgi:shikimate dehydrogenase